MKKFARRRRFGVLLGDYQYVTMQFPAALATYRRLLAGAVGKPGRAEQAYLQYACGAVCFQLQRCRKATEHLRRAAELGKGLTRERALFARAKITGGPEYAGLFSKEEQEEAREVLAELARKAKSEEFRCKSMMLLAKWRFELGDREEALALLERVPRKSKYHKLASSYRRIFTEE